MTAHICQIVYGYIPVTILNTIHTETLPCSRCLPKLNRSRRKVVIVPFEKDVHIHKSYRLLYVLILQTVFIKHLKRNTTSVCKLYITNGEYIELDFLLQYISIHTETETLPG